MTWTLHLIHCCLAHHQQHPFFFFFSESKSDARNKRGHVSTCCSRSCLSHLCLMIILGVIASYPFRPFSSHLLHILYESLTVRPFPKVPINRFSFYCLREPFAKHHPTPHPFSHTDTHASHFGTQFVSKVSNIKTESNSHLNESTRQNIRYSVDTLCPRIPYERVYTDKSFW